MRPARQHLNHDHDLVANRALHINPVPYGDRREGSRRFVHVIRGREPKKTPCRREGRVSKTVLQVRGRRIKVAFCILLFL